jgi:transcriptional regulator with XRE-family HTH domain
MQVIYWSSSSRMNSAPGQGMTTMARKFDELRARMSPERRQRNQREAARALLDLTLQELRQNLATLSQDEVAEILEVTQGYVSRLERQGDMLLSRLYGYVQALGGDVEIRARFPDQEVRITQFKELSKLKAALRHPARGRRFRT